MNLNFEITNHAILQSAYREFGLDMGDKFMKAALKRSGKIGVKAVQDKAQAVFVGAHTSRLFVPRKTRFSNVLNYRRGGATEKDIRAKVVKDFETWKLLIGVSKSSGKVGWRTHFLEFGTKKMSAKPFVYNSVQDVLPKIDADLQNSLDIVIARYRNRL